MPTMFVIKKTEAKMFNATRYVHLVDLGTEVIEVFKTNVQTEVDAKMLISQINLECGYEANFDLVDCDRVLRVKGFSVVSNSHIIDLLRNKGFSVEILSDEVPTDASHSSS
jgi:hypothetical protein